MNEMLEPGMFVRHRYLAKKDPTKPNLRQVLLVDTGMHADISARGIVIGPGMLGENVLLEGIRVMGLPIGTRLELGEALLQLTEVRNPCYQLNEIDPRLLKAVAYKSNGQVYRNAGMMGRILSGGWNNIPIRLQNRGLVDLMLLFGLSLH